MDDYVTQLAHEEFKSCVMSENARQDARLDRLEDRIGEISKLTISVEKLAVNMDGMLKELTEQNSRLKTLESRDGENWRKIVGSIITGVAAAVLGFVLGKIGL